MPSIFLAEAQKPKLTSTRRSAFLLAILSPTCGCMFVGFAKLWHGADAEAVAWLRRGLEANRNYSVAHFHLAAALARLGELDEARATVQAGLALDPASRSAAIALARLATIRRI